MRKKIIGFLSLITGVAFAVSALRLIDQAIAISDPVVDLFFAFVLIIFGVVRLFS